MKVIDECCCECITQNLNGTKASCPVCNNEGVTVSRITVEHLVTDDYRNAVDGDQYKICMNEDCDVIYYNLDKEIKVRKILNTIITHKRLLTGKSFVCYYI